MNNSDLRVIKTRNALKKAMSELIKEKPLDKISVIDICNRALVNRATFYSHYEDKYALFEESAREFFKPLDMPVPESISPDEYKHYYLEIAYNMLTYIEKEKQTCKALFQKNAYFENYLLKYMHDHLLTSFSHSAKMQVRLPLEPEVMAVYYSGAVTSLIKWWVNSDFSVSAETMCRYLNILLNP